MKLNAFKIVGLTALTLTVSLATVHTTAHASYYLNGNDYAREATHLVTARKTVPVYKVRTGNCEANNRFTFYKYLRRGSHVYSSPYFMSTGGWIIKSKNLYYHNSRTFFIVPNNNHHWYYK